MTYLIIYEIVLTFNCKIFIRLMCELLCSFSWWSIEGKSKKSSSYEELFLLLSFFYKNKRSKLNFNLLPCTRGITLAWDLRSQMLDSRCIAVWRRSRSAVLDINKLHLAWLDLDDHCYIVAGGQTIMELLVILV